MKGQVNESVVQRMYLEGSPCLISSLSKTTFVHRCSSINIQTGVHRIVMSEYLRYAKEFLSKEPLEKVKPDEVHEVINRLSGALLEIVAHLEEQEQKLSAA